MNTIILVLRRWFFISNGIINLFPSKNIVINKIYCSTFYILNMRVNTKSPQISDILKVKEKAAFSTALSFREWLICIFLSYAQC